MSSSGFSNWRRTKSAIGVLIAQILLIATTLALSVQLIFMAKYGEILFIEQNHTILYGEIALTGCICIYATMTFVHQWKRMGEKRKEDRRTGKTPNSNSQIPNKD
jgi:hypothetical protein